MSFVIPGGNDNYVLEDVLSSALAGQVANPESSDIRAKYGLVILMQETSEQELIDLAADLPTDTHLVSYRTAEGVVGADAVRAHKQADVFDYYHDRACEILAISSGFGRIKPRSYNEKKP